MKNLKIGLLISLLIVGQGLMPCDADKNTENSFLTKMKYLANEGIPGEGTSDEGFFKNHPKIRNSSFQLSKFVFLGSAYATAALPLAGMMRNEKDVCLFARAVLPGLIIPMVYAPIATALSKDRPLTDGRDDIKRQIYATGQCANIVEAASSFAGYPLGWAVSVAGCVGAQAVIAGMTGK